MSSVEVKREQARARNLLSEYQDIILKTVEEVNRELNVEITGSTSDEIALEYKRRAGGREALKNFLTRLNSKANDR